MGFLDIFSEHFVMRIRLIIYIVLAFFSFFIFVGIAVMKDKFQGECPLYVDLNNPYPTVGNCNYPMAVAIIFQLIYALYRIVILLLLVLGKFQTELFIFSNIMEFVYIILDIIACILTFIGACILSAGHNSANSYIWGRSSAAKSASQAAQAGAWIGTFLWLAVCAIGTVYIFRAGKLPFGRRDNAGAAGTTGTSPSANPVDAPPNYDPPKY